MRCVFTVVSLIESLCEMCVHGYSLMESLCDVCSRLFHLKLFH